MAKPKKKTQKSKLTQTRGFRRRRWSSKQRFSSNLLFSLSGWIWLASLFFLSKYLDLINFVVGGLPGKSSLWDLSSMELELFTLNLAQQNRLLCTQDVSLLNYFENVLINEIVFEIQDYFEEEKKSLLLLLLCFYLKIKKRRRKSKPIIWYNNNS